MVWKFIEEPVVTELNEASEDAKETSNEETNDSHDEINAKEEAAVAPIETSSEPARGLGSFTYHSFPLKFT